MEIDATSADIGQPLLFRTASDSVSKAALSTGSLWLRSDQYYRDLEDQFRNDQLEGVGSGATKVPIRVRAGGVNFQIHGDGALGQVLPPHYLLCLHGTSISEAQRSQFGGHTFGVRNFARLSIEILFQAARQISCTGYRYGQVSYQYTAFSVSPFLRGAPINLGGSPPLGLGPINAEILRKRPVYPFIEQDEWRIAIFTEGYLGSDAGAPLKINVAPESFYLCSHA